MTQHRETVQNGVICPPQVRLRLIEELRRRGWTLYQFGRRKPGPDLLAATYVWETCSDVVIIRDEHSATAYRTPKPWRDVLRPELVTRVYAGPVEDVLHAVFNQPPPGQQQTEPQPMTAPAGFGVPTSCEQPVIIRPLGLHR